MWVLGTHLRVEAERQVLLAKFASHFADSIRQRAVLGNLPIKSHPGGDQQYTGVDEREWRVRLVPDVLGQGTLKGVNRIFYRFHAVLGPGRRTLFERLLQHADRFPHPLLNTRLQVTGNRLIDDVYL